VAPTLIDAALPQPSLASRTHRRAARPDPVASSPSWRPLLDPGTARPFLFATPTILGELRRHFRDFVDGPPPRICWAQSGGGRTQQLFATRVAARCDDLAGWTTPRDR
jgi:hypothetical protein